MNDISVSTVAHRSPKPSPYADRNSLSEAWYRALYGARAGAATVQNGADSARFQAASMPRSAASSNVTEPAGGKGGSLLSNARNGRVNARAALDVLSSRVRPKPRETAPSSAQRAWRASIARRLACNVLLEDGRSLDVLVQQRGRHVHVLALTETDATRAALARAQTALALAGVRVDIVARRKGQS